MLSSIISTAIIFKDYMTSLGHSFQASFYSNMAKISLGYYIVLTIGCFLFKSILTYKFAKKNNLSKCFLAFIPFANYILIGKLIGKVRVFSATFKNIGVYVMVISLAQFLVSVSYDIYVFYDEFWTLFKTGEIVLEPTVGNYAAYNALKAFDLVLSFANIAFLIWMGMALISKYNRRRTILLAILLLIGLISEPVWIMFNLFFAIILCNLVNKKPLTPEDYLRMQEEYLRSRGIRVEYRNQPNAQTDVDPFDEFSSKNDSALNQDVFTDFTPNNSDKDKNNDDYFN